MTIYPEIETQTMSYEILRRELRVKVFTHLRKQHTDGKWYLVPFLEGGILPMAMYDSSQKYFEAAKQFISETERRLIRAVYVFQIVGIIEPDMVGANGISFYELDPDQQSEKERVLPKITQE